MLRRLHDLYGGGLRTLVWFVTERCNARCLHCYQGGNGGGGAELTVDEVGRITSRLGRLLLLQCSGGEPFLREDLGEMLDRFAAISGAVTVPTNATFPERIERIAGKVAREHPGTLVRIALSIDGIGGDHDTIRGLPGNFERILETVGRLQTLRSRRNFLLSVNTVYSRTNEKAIFDIVDGVAGLGVDGHTLTYIWGGPGEGDLGNPSRDRYRRAVAKGESLRPGRGGSGFGAGAVRALNRIADREIFRILEGADSTFPCQSLRKYALLSATGEMTACHLQESSLGNVRDHGYDLQAMLAEKPAVDLREEIVGKGCTCRVQCNNRNNILYSPRTPFSAAGHLLKAKLTG